MKQAVRDLAVKRTIEALYTGGVLEWSPDGSTLYSTCTNVVKAINLDDNLSCCTIGDPEETLRITCICLDKNRSRLLVAYTNYVVREYSLGENIGEVARSWKTMHTAPILSMKFSHDGSMLATGSADHTVKIWDMVQQHCTHTLKGPGVVSALSFVQNSRLMVGYVEGQICMFDLVKGAIHKLLREWKTHSSQVTGFVELSGSRRVVAVSRDQTASITEIETREVLKVFPLFEAVESAALAHNGNLITVGEEGIVKEWIINSGNVLRRKKLATVGLDFLAYNPVRDQILVTSVEENIFIVSFDDLSLRRQIVGFHDEMFVCRMDKMVKLWHIDTAKMRLGIAGTLSGHRRGVADARFSPNSLKVASSSGDMTIKIWSLQDKTCLQTLNGHNSAVFRILFVNHGSQLMSADSAGIIKIWTLADSDASISIEAHNDKIWTLLVNRDESEYVTAGTDGRIIVWRDVSEEKKLEEEVKIRKRMEEEQTLNNLLEQDRFQEALEYALGLVVDRLIDRGELMTAVMKLDKQRLQTLLDFATQWNTNSRTSMASQYVVNCILKIVPADELLELPNIRSSIESLIPYTKRHMERLNKVRQDVSLLNFTWNQMRLN
ncbi:Utp13 specific WD40 associated domain protein [Oesophagostomum dentatum]|uniref:Utp13 specific WD40 associated domain protein n=1 Tax=Oesophagostomum dentatum TaxID=61180 RepID=A0A0B1TMC5_OESDE|nr:Utp13 specific WD40 associated domain protein [Oesophagostomum dentatum]